MTMSSSSEMVEIETEAASELGMLELGVELGELGSIAEVSALLNKPVAVVGKPNGRVGFDLAEVVELETGFPCEMGLLEAVGLLEVGLLAGVLCRIGVLGAVVNPEPAT